MKTVILCGGLGTRLGEETDLKPKPMVEIGGNPILWHIMNIYAAQGFGEFIAALGYKGDVIKRYFLQFYAMNNDLTVDLKSGRNDVRSEGEGGKPGKPGRPDWLVHLIDTGDNAQTGGRMRAVRKWVEGETFMMTYGDGVADIDVKKLVEFHKSHGKLATVTAVRPPARFGGLVIEKDKVVTFTEKPQAEGGWINGGFFVLESAVIDYIESNDTLWEHEPLERLSQAGELMAFRHEGFWQPMDTLRDKRILESLWEEGKAPWRVW